MIFIQKVRLTMSCPPDSLFAPQSYGPAEGAETTEERKRREEEERLARERAERAKRERLCPACCKKVAKCCKYLTDLHTESLDFRQRQ